MLWFLDEIFFPQYRQQQLDGLVVIVAPPRSGSTTLHRAITSDTDHFVAPCAMELVLPFVPVMAALHWARCRPKARAPLTLPARISACKCTRDCGPAAPRGRTGRAGRGLFAVYNPFQCNFEIKKNKC